MPNDIEFSPRRIHLAVALTIFVAAAMYGSLVPLRFVPLSFEEALARFSQLPFFELGVQSKTDWATNVLLFVPIGFFGLAVLGIDRSRRAAWAFAPLVIACCLVLSVAIEFSQIWFPPRTPSQRDIAAESIGGALGCALWLFFGQATIDWLRGRFANAASSRLIDWLLCFCVAGLIVHAALPFDLTIGLGELHDKYEAGRIRLVPFANADVARPFAAYELLKSAIVFVPVGALSATIFVRRDREVRSFLISLALSATLAVGILTLRILVESAYADTTDVFANLVGATVGILLARRFLRRNAEAVTPSDDQAPRSAWAAWLGIAILYACVVATIFLFPLDFSVERSVIKERLHAFVDVPFSKMYVGSIVESFANLLYKTLLFVPLGGFVAAAAYAARVPNGFRRALLFAGAVACFGVGLAIELGQLFSPKHVPDLTDVLICFAGSLAGMFVASRVYGSRRCGSPKASLD